MLPSSGYTCRAHNSGCGCHIVPFAWERRSRLKGIGHGAAPTPTVGSSRGGLLGLACAVVPWLTWVPALAERLGENSWARASVLLVKKIGQWELSLEVNRSTRALPKISQILWIVSRWSVHSSEETLFLDHMSAPWFILPSTCVAFSERRLFWAHTRRSFTSVQSRFETRPPWWFIYDTTDLLSERISTWCTRMSGRKNWQAWHTASISRQLMCGLDFSSDHRPKVNLPSHSTPQPLLEVFVVTTFLLCAVSRITPHFSQKGSLQRARADTQARVTVTPWRPWRQATDGTLCFSQNWMGDVKQTQLKHRWSHCHKVQHSLESFERTGGTFREGGRVALNCHGSLRWDSCCYLHWVDNCTQVWNSFAGWQYALGKVDPEHQAV